MEEPSIHDELEIIPVTNSGKDVEDDEDNLSSENGSEQDETASGDGTELSASAGKPSAAEIERINAAKAREEQEAKEKDEQESEEQSVDVTVASNPKKAKKTKLMSYNWYQIGPHADFWIVVRYT